jgi:hypothetical protein
MSSSSVKRDLAYGDATSRRLPDGGSLALWGAAVHGEEGMVVQLLKRVWMPSSMSAPVGFVFLVGGDGGGISHSLFLGETSNLEEATIDDGACGRRSHRWRRYVGLLERMMATSALLPPWGHHLWRFIGWMDVWTAWWLGIGLRVFLTWGPSWSGASVPGML